MFDILNFELLVENYLFFKTGWAKNVFWFWPVTVTSLLITEFNQEYIAQITFPWAQSSFANKSHLFLTLNPFTQIPRITFLTYWYQYDTDFIVKDDEQIFHDYADNEVVMVRQWTFARRWWAGAEAMDVGLFSIALLPQCGLLFHSTFWLKESWYVWPPLVLILRIFVICL